MSCYEHLKLCKQIWIVSLTKHSVGFLHSLFQPSFGFLFYIDTICCINRWNVGSMWLNFRLCFVQEPVYGVAYVFLTNGICFSIPLASSKLKKISWTGVCLIDGFSNISANSMNFDMPCAFLVQFSLVSKVNYGENQWFSSKKLTSCSSKLILEIVFIMSMHYYLTLCGLF